VLKAPDIPSILVETAFHLQSRRGIEAAQQQSTKPSFAESMGDGIRRYFAANPPLARVTTSTGVSVVVGVRSTRGDQQDESGNRAQLYDVATFAAPVPRCPPLLTHFMPTAIVTKTRT